MPVCGALLLAAIVLLAGCGGSGDGDPETTPTGAAATAEAGGADSAERSDPKPLLADGDRVLLIGDSLATEAPPTYADLLPDAAAKLGVEGVETHNLAEPGSTSEDWLPGAPLFEQRLRPELGSADLVLITVGGNDLERAIGASDGVEALGTGAAAADGAFAAIERSGANLRRSFAAIRRANPRLRIAYVAYPDYSASSAWQAAGGSGANLALGIGLGALLDAARAARPDAVVEMLALSGRRPGGVDPLLATDPQYLSAAGHRFYAKQIAAELSR